MRNNRNAKMISIYFGNSKTDTVNTDRTFLNNVSYYTGICAYCYPHRIFFPRKRCYRSCSVNMARHNMSAESSVRRHRALKINLVVTAAHRQAAPSHSFRHDVGFKSVFSNCRHGKAHAVYRNAFADFRTLQNLFCINIYRAGFTGHMNLFDCSYFLYNTRKQFYTSHLYFLIDDTEVKGPCVSCLHAKVMTPISFHSDYFLPYMLSICRSRQLMIQRIPVHNIHPGTRLPRRQRASWQNLRIL